MLGREPGSRLARAWSSGKDMPKWSTHILSLVTTPLSADEPSFHRFLGGAGSPCATALALAIASALAARAWRSRAPLRALVSTSVRKEPRKTASKAMPLCAMPWRSSHVIKRIHAFLMSQMVLGTQREALPRVITCCAKRSDPIPTREATLVAHM